MSNEAFAGFLRLLLTPFHREPKICPEVRAYLDYLNRVEPRDSKAA